MRTFDVSIIALARDKSNARLQRFMKTFDEADISYEVFTWESGGKITRVLKSWIVPFFAKGKILFTPDPESAIAISYIARLRRLKWAVDVREDYKLLIQDRSWATGTKKMIGTFIADAAVSASAKADLTIVVDDWVQPLKAINRVVLHNNPDIRFLPEPTNPASKPRAIYVGDVRKSRGLFTMLKAIELTDNWTLDIVGKIAKQDKNELDKWLATSSAVDRVRFHGNLGAHESWKFAEGAWVGLALLEPTPAFMRAWPTKIGEYIACGLPVIATDLPRAAEVILKEPRPGALVEIENDDVIAMQSAAILNSWSENPDEYGEVRQRALQNVQHWRNVGNYQMLAQEILNLTR